MFGSSPQLHSASACISDLSCNIVLKLFLSFCTLERRITPHTTGRRKKTFLLKTTSMCQPGSLLPSWKLLHQIWKNVNSINSWIKRRSGCDAKTPCRSDIHSGIFPTPEMPHVSLAYVQEATLWTLSRQWSASRRTLASCPICMPITWALQV